MGVPVEVCREDGEWVEAETVGSKKKNKYARRCLQLAVRFPDGTEQSLSIGMVISRDEGAPYEWKAEEDAAIDFTRSRGRSNKELLDECRAQAREYAVTGSKDYCR